MHEMPLHWPHAGVPILSAGARLFVALTSAIKSDYGGSLVPLAGRVIVIGTRPAEDTSQPHDCAGCPH